MDTRPSPLETAVRLWQQRFQPAIALFCAGSVVRGEQSPHSDLDIVVLFDHIPNASRESVLFEGWPVELFIHDLETLPHFVQNDCQIRRPTLPSMLAQAFVVPAPSPISERVQAWARQLLENPTPVPRAALDHDRYVISDLLDDLRDPRPRAELVAIAVRLYQPLGEFILKSANRWSGSGKHLPRALHALDPATAIAFNHAFDCAFRLSDAEALIHFAEQVLHPFGGVLFDGYRSVADSSARTVRAAAGTDSDFLGGGLTQA